MGIYLKIVESCNVSMYLIYLDEIYLNCMKCSLILIDLVGFDDLLVNPSEKCVQL